MNFLYKLNWSYYYVFYKFNTIFHFFLYIIGEEVDEEVKDAVADEPDIEDIPQEIDEDSTFDEELEDEDQNDPEEEDQEQGRNTATISCSFFMLAAQKCFRAQIP